MHNVPEDQCRPLISKGEVQLPLPYVGVLPLPPFSPQLLLLVFQALEEEEILQVSEAAGLSPGIPIVRTKLSETWKKLWQPFIFIYFLCQILRQKKKLWKLSHQSLVNRTGLRRFLYILLHCCKKGWRWLFRAEKKICERPCSGVNLNIPLRPNGTCLNVGN